MNLKAIKKSTSKIIIDPMWGSSSGYLTKILAHSKMTILALHQDRDVLFGGKRPEPLAQNLPELIAAMKKTKSDIGLVTDGDGDRVACVDSKGVFHSSQDIIPLLMLHLLDNRKWKGGVVKTNATTSVMELIAKEYGLKIHETPIGFKHVADLMVKEDILIGGEESGGIGIKNYIPERDGVLMCLLLLELMAETKKTILQLFKELKTRFGDFYYDRIDLTYDSNKKEKIAKMLAEIASEVINGQKVSKITRFDGTKFIFEDHSWLLLRASGTEPVLRIYSEARSKAEVKKFLEYGAGFINKI